VWGEGIDVQIHVFLTSALDRIQRSDPDSNGSNIQGKSPDTEHRGHRMGPRAGLDVTKSKNFLNLRGLELRAVGSPSCILPIRWLYML
jgi:hypothetical protein